jgi:hypothetical protein
MVLRDTPRDAAREPPRDDPGCEGRRIADWAWTSGEARLIMAALRSSELVKPVLMTAMAPATDASCIASIARVVFFRAEGAAP